MNKELLTLILQNEQVQKTIMKLVQEEMKNGSTEAYAEYKEKTKELITELLSHITGNSSFLEFIKDS